MKRRDMLKGVAVAAAGTFISLRATKGEAKTVQTLTSETYSGETRRMKVELHVYPDKDGKFNGRFQELVEDWWQRNDEHFRPVEAIAFEPLMEDGEQWLVHSAWKSVSKDNLSTLYTEGRNIFREHRWSVIDRAVYLREMGYWRQEYGPQFKGMLDGGGMSPGTAHWRMFRRVVRKRLHKVVVRFEAVSLADIERYSDGEYGQLELEALVWEDLRKEGKLTPRTYFEQQNERFDRLGQLEVEALESSSMTPSV